MRVTGEELIMLESIIDKLDVHKRKLDRFADACTLLNQGTLGEELKRVRNETELICMNLHLMLQPKDNPDE